MKRFLTVFLALAVLVTTGAGCFGGGSTGTASGEKITLKYWRVFDDEDTMEGIIDAYSALHPNVEIEYKKLRPEEYETELVKALARGEGPDMFSIHNTKMGEYKSLLTPMPSTLNVSYLETRGTLRKETSLVARQESTPSLKSFRDTYIDAVTNDVLMDYQPDPKEAAVSKVYGVPLAVDTLALFYNKQLLNAAGIAQPPANWDEMLADIPKLTKIDATGKITQSGAALGTSENVESVTDIMSVLMMQNGTVMEDDRGRVAFDTIPQGIARDEEPGLNAVRFYTDFANPTKVVYTWNADFANSREAFANGQTAFYLGYSFDVPLIKSAAPKLEYDIAPLPQITGGKKVNYANFWAEGVSKTSKHDDYAWNFLLFAANKENVKSYLSAAEKPTALRSLIDSQAEDETLGVFASQLLTADTWYHGTDADAMEKAFKNLADTILVGTTEEEKALSQAARVVSQTYE
jgi:multiple sugar transport system substrate-binding protein